ncbi:dirigent protein 22-like [Malania oleifera]|uniref:dirigent protein 22-like n=1 Tax=Malania oleifera TaxID=397392 RepID=UPI0025AEC797|nr:dirigent protein 22-like [Malania oleifera]
MKGQVVIVYLWVLVFMVTINPTPTRCAYYSVAKPLQPLKPNLVQLNFYVRENLTGLNATAIVVAHGPRTQQRSDTAALSFGTLLVVDDPITEIPNGKPIGSARGYYAATSLKSEELTLVMTLVFSFTTGLYNGSSLSVLGVSHPLSNNRSMSVVGGTGLLFLAGGPVAVTTITRNTSSFDAILSLKVNVIYYDKPSSLTS